MKITVDDRERDSGIITLLKNSGFAVTLTRLSCCDYIIGDEIYIERKTAKDFLVSIIDGRLFKQASTMKKSLPRPIFLVEGNPFQLDLNFSPDAIRGAILSLQVSWYIPVVFSKTREETCRIFRSIGDQVLRETNLLTLRHGYRPKKLITRQLHVLQGLPNIGPLLAKRMLGEFGSVRKVFNATKQELESIEGIGPTTAKEICKVLCEQ